MTIYTRTRDEHWLWDKQNQGMGLILEDNSNWEVHPSDRSVTSRWLRGSTIYVEETQTKGYPYVLRNRTEGETARASFLGEFRAVGWDSRGIRERILFLWVLIHPQGQNVTSVLLQALRGVTCPLAIGAGLAEIGLIFASFKRSFSTFFCS